MRKIRVQRKQIIDSSFKEYLDKVSEETTAWPNWLKQSRNMLTQDPDFEVDSDLAEHKPNLHMRTKLHMPTKALPPNKTHI